METKQKHSKELEKALIKLGKTVTGCLNEKPGGEGAPRENLTPTFVYVVVTKDTTVSLAAIGAERAKSHWDTFRQTRR